MLFWRWWCRHQAEPSEIAKMVSGAFLMACAHLIFAAASYSADSWEMTSVPPAVPGGFSYRSVRDQNAADTANP